MNRFESPQRSVDGALGGLMLGAAGMFATLYSTQAILPDSESLRKHSVARGLTVSVMIVALGVIS